MTVVFAGCYKNNYTSLSGGSAITIVNAVVGSNPLVTNFTPGNGGKGGPDTLAYYYSATQIRYSSFTEFGWYTGNTSLSVSPITDTFFVAWSGMVDLTPNTIHTLFLIGPDSTQIDTLFTLDSPPGHPPTDSSVGVRFVNVSPGSQPVSVDLQGMSPGSEVESLSYKGVTPFKSYSANSNSPGSYVFEFRDPTSGNLLASYSMTGVTYGTNGNTRANTWRFRNVTIALMGVAGGSQRAYEINNY
jgi:hypothetical protein